MRSIDLLGEVAVDLTRVEECLRETVASHDPLLHRASLHPLEAGGKRLRPAMVLLSGRLFDGAADRLIPIAAGMELMHMATLVHDDVIDNSTLRRGRPTVNSVWSSKVAVLVGDYLFANAVALIADRSPAEIVKVVADLVVEICHGEIHQNRLSFDLGLSEEDYLRRIRQKTAGFFRVCTQLGAMFSGANADEVATVGEYGELVGTAFQMADDLLDLNGSAEELGKPVGGDMCAGVYTLPVIYALERSPQADRLRWLLSLEYMTPEMVAEAIAIVAGSGGIEHTRDHAARCVARAKAALGGLPPSRARMTLEDLGDFVLARTW
jgi:heptaprenyl diphosphate synthase